MADDGPDSFDSFDPFEEDRMDISGTLTQPIVLDDSDDSFDAGPAKPTVLDRKAVVEKYHMLKKEAEQLDELAREVRNLVLICKQMEECYSKRVNRTEMLASSAEVRHLHDGTALLLVTVHNITDRPMVDWILSIHPTPIHPQIASTSSQTIALGSLLPGTRKTFECHVARDACAPPVLLQLSLIREFQLEEVRKVFHVDLDPICVTLWDEMQRIKDRNVNSSFHTSIRLPNCLIDLLSGRPDTVVTPSQVFRAVLHLDVEPNTSDVVLCLQSSSSSVLVKISCSRDGGTHHSLSIGTESSRSHAALVEQLRLRLCVEMSKLKSRPAKKGIGIVAEMGTAGSIEELFQSTLSAFY
ncbi:unnamed protein product [Caenorhabditis sp. 36 PRJEB53466]|nr:unnamed protein product [Caenorhabditis sp. 36 PRJEB53466]